MDSGQFEANRIVRQDEKSQRREQALRGFEKSRKIAEHYGMELSKKTDAHYQLSCNGWTINISPGNCRLWHDKNAGIKPPYLNLPTEWTLRDVVCFAARGDSQEKETL